MQSRIFDWTEGVCCHCLGICFHSHSGVELNVLQRSLSKDPFLTSLQFPIPACSAVPARSLQDGLGAQ